MRHFLPFLIIISLIVGCKEQPTNPNYQLYPIDLKVTELPKGGWRYDWTKIKTRDFKAYWIVRSELDSVPYLSENNINLLDDNSEIVGIINDPDSTGLVDTNSIVTRNGFVRVFAFLGDRALSSFNKPVRANSNMESLPVRADEFLFEPSSRILGVVNHSKFRICSYNIDTRRKQVRNFSVSFATISSNSKSKILKNDFGTELFLNLSNQQFSIVNMENLGKRPLNTFNFGSDFIAYRDRFFVSSFNQVSQFRRQGFDTFNIFLGFETALFQVINAQQVLNINIKQLPNKKEFWAIHNPSVNVFDIAKIKYETIDNGGQAYRYTTQRLENIKTFTADPFVFSPDGAHIIMDKKGTIVESLQFTPINGNLTLRPNFMYKKFIFNDNGLILYALREDESPKSTIDVFDFPSGNFIKSIPTSLKALDFFKNNDELLILGNSPNLSEKSFLERIKL